MEYNYSFSEQVFDKTTNNGEEIFQTLELEDSTSIFEMIQSGKVSPAQPLGSDRLTIIHYICQLGKLQLLKDIASTHPESIVHTVLSQYSLLHCACKHGQVCIVQYLIDNGLYDETVLTTDGDSSPLHLAVEEGQLSVVVYLIEHSVCHPMLVDKDGNTPIHASCLHGQFDIVKYLEKTGKYDPNVVNCHTQQTPLHVAAKKGHVNIVQYLVEEGKFDPSCVDDVGGTPLYLAVWDGRFKTVQYLASKSKGELLAITTGEDMDDDGSLVAAGKTPLHAACLHGYFDIVQYLVEECHCNLTCGDAKGNLPLHSASAGGNSKIVKYLIEECKCDPMCYDGDKVDPWVPLHIAARKGHLPITKYLIEEHGCDPMHCTKRGCAPLHIASEKGHFDTVKYLIEECKCDPMSVRSDEQFQDVPLHFAARNGRLPITKYLIEEHGCDPMCCTKKGAVPIHLASQNGHFDTVKYLIEECKCDPMSVQYDEQFQWAPLHFAASYGHLPITKYLIEEHGCDPTCCTKTGHAPLHLASEKGHFDTLRYLIEECNCDPMSMQFDEQLHWVPLHYAASNGHLQSTKYFIEEYGCDPMCYTNKGVALLHLASKNGHFDTVKYLIEECKCDPMSQQYDEQFQFVPLHFAASNGHLPITKYLIEEHGCDPLCCTKTGRTLLHLASGNGHFDTMRYLIEECNCAPMSMQYDEQFQFVPLHFAASNGHLPITKYLIEEHGCDPMCCTKGGLQPIHLASENGHFDIVKYLIEQCKCDPMCCDGHHADPWVPLHFAASNGHLSIAKYLIEEHGCDPMCLTKKGFAPLHQASENGYFDIVKYLIEESKCDPMSQQREEQFQWVPLQLAARKGHLPIAKYLVEEHGCDPMYCRNRKVGETPFHLASEEGHIDVVKYLIEKQEYDPRSQMKLGKAALHTAASEGHLPLIKYLIEDHGCDPMCYSKEGFAPLHLASEEGHFDIVKYLIEKQGCNPRCQMKLGRTALHFAAEKEHTKLVNYLLAEGADPIILASSFPQFTNEHYPYLFYYRADVPLAGTKVFVLGNQGAGKSSLVESLKQEEKWFRGRFTNVQVSPNTAGIISHLFTSQNFGDVMLYDFAGHSVYYASHSVLIQNGTGSSQVLVFVLVLDLRLPTGDFTSQLEYWVSFLMCTCSAKMSLVIAGSHYDHAMSSIDFQAKKAVITKFKETMNDARLSISFVPLDCRKAKSTGIDEIRRIICQLSKGMNGKGMISTFHYMLLAFLRWIFGSTVAFQLGEAIERLYCTSIPLISVDKEYIYTLCEDLCAVSCILLLKNNTLSKSWIALDQSKVLNEIQRFKQNDDFVSTMKHISTGIVPHSLLVNNFPSRNGVTLDFVLRYMVEMEYCQLVDGGVLGKPMLDEPHYFFPDQVLGESATHVWPSDEKYKRYFGWLLKCKRDFFFPRFVQVLLLRLATQKELVGAQDHISGNSLSQLRQGTKIWKSGVSWIDSGCEVVVEIIENSTGILVMTRCWNDYEVSHCRVRSAVIKTILKVKEDIYPKPKEDICRQLETKEFIISLKQIIQYPPPHTSLLQVVDMCELTPRCSQPEPHVVVLYSKHGSSQMTVADLIGFDPFLFLSKAGLNVLFNGPDHVMSSDTLRDIADDLSEHWEPMCKVLGLQSKEFQRKLKDNPPDPTDKCLSAIVEACRVSTGGPVTNRWLREKLEKYSIVGESNLLVSDTIIIM